MMGHLCRQCSPVRSCVEGTYSQRESRDLDVFLFSPDLEESRLLMAPENSKLNQRLTGLELQIKDHTEKIGIFKQGLATLSTQVQSIGDRAVTSWQLLTRVLLPLLGTVLAAALAVYFGL